MSNDIRTNRNAANGDFDLDAFFKSFDFATAQKQSDTQASTGRMREETSLDSTMTYAAIGEQAPELPFAYEEEDAYGFYEHRKDSSIHERRPYSDREELPADEFENLPPTSSRQSADPREAAGTRQPAEPRQSALSRLSAAPRKLVESRKSATPRQSTEARQSAEVRQSAEPRSSVTSRQSPASRQSAAPRQSPAPRQAPASRQSAQPRSFIGFQNPLRREQASRPTPTRTSRSSSRRPEYQEPYVPLDGRLGSYKIRGGGRNQLRSPVLIVLYCLIVIVGIGLAGLAVNKVSDMLSNSGLKNPVTLTPAQTREAIDGRLPILLDILDLEFVDVTKMFEEAGHTIFQDDRYVPDSTDPGAKKTGLISMPQIVTMDFMTGFYESTYNAYSIEELEQYFNGTWVLDMARGDLGSQFKVRYMNLNGVSVKEEMQHLAVLQGLTGEGVELLAQGADTRGNIVMQGTKTIDEIVYYWKIAACQFNEVYVAKWLPDNAVYISCTIADFDFYTGTDTITPS